MCQSQFINPTGITFPVLTYGRDTGNIYGANTSNFYVVNSDSNVSYISRYYDEASLQAHLNEITDVAKSPTFEAPDDFSLAQNYPNPFNPTTQISYRIKSLNPINVELTVYNVLGIKVRTLVNRKQTTGNYSANWDGRDDSGELLPAGLYYYKIKAGDFNQTKKMLFIQ